MAGEVDRRDPVSGRLAPDEPPELIDEIRVVDGDEGRTLAAVQARVLWEVTEWLARNRSAHGRDPTA